MSTTIGIIRAPEFDAALQLTEFMGPVGIDSALQLTPTNGSYAQLTPDAVLRLAVVLEAWARSRGAK